MKKIFLAIMFACSSFAQAMMSQVGFVIPFVPERNLILLEKNLNGALTPLNFNEEYQERYAQNLGHDSNFEFIYKELDQKTYRFLPVQYFEISKNHTFYVPYSSLEWVPLHQVNINNPAFQEDLRKRISSDVKTLLNMNDVKQNLEKLSTKAKEMERTRAKETEKKLKNELPKKNQLEPSETSSLKNSSSGFFASNLSNQTKTFVAGIGILAFGAYVLYNNPASIIESVKSFVTSCWQKATH